MLLLSGGKGISEESMTTALVRARMCELLGWQIEGGRTEMAFTAGMLSGLDVLLGLPARRGACATCPSTTTSAPRCSTTTVPSAAWWPT